MPLTYNLLDEPWIPCVDKNGKAISLGIRQTLYQSYTIRAVQGDTPLVTAALFRLLLAILHRVFGPSSHSAWKKLWHTGKWDQAKLEGYFSEWEDHFDLFHPKFPFYQQTDDRVKNKTALSLIPHLASGNNATLFSHHTENEGIFLDCAEAAIVLLVSQVYGLAGLSGLPEKFTDSPTSRGITFLLHGENLFQSFLLNMVQYDPENGKPFFVINQDLPAWEQDAVYADLRTQPYGYLDYLTWQSRRISLVPKELNGKILVSEITIAPGLRFNSDLQREGTLFDPFSHYRKDDKRGWLVMRYQESRDLWRDSAALFAIQSKQQFHAPDTFSALDTRVADGGISEQRKFNFQALGMASNQAKVEFYRTESMPLPVVYLENPELVTYLRGSLTQAEEVRNKLWGALRRFAALLLSPTSDEKEGRKSDPKDISNLTQHWQAEQQYWKDLELHFYLLLEDLPDNAEIAQRAWANTLRQAAQEAFASAERMAGTSQRAFRAAVKAREQLLIGLTKTSPKLTQEENE